LKSEVLLALNHSEIDNAIFASHIGQNRWLTGGNPLLTPCFVLKARSKKGIFPVGKLFQLTWEPKSSLFFCMPKICQFD